MLKYIVLGLALLSFSGCASYSSGFQKVEVLLGQQKPQQALAELEKSPATGKDELLYLLDRAMLQRMSGMYQQSNASFEQAKKLVEKLDAVSITEQAGALTINDSMMSYEGEDYEQVAIHLFAALNYIKLGLWDEARVESLQVDMRLKKIAEDQKVKFEADAFSRYLAGIIYEQLGELDNAMISYRKSYETYKSQKQPVPQFLKEDLLRISKYLGLNNEYAQYQKQFNMKETLSARALNSQGEVILLLHHSLAPIKRSVSSLHMGRNGVRHRISLPEYQSRPSYVTRATLTIGNASVNAAIVNDFDRAARKSLQRHKPAMIARMIARVILKKAAAKAANDNNGGLAGLLVDVAGMATETADTRSWLTLPKNTLMARLAQKEGTYPATLTLYGAKGQVLEVMNLGNLELKKGKKLVIEKSYIRPLVQEKQ